MKVYIASSTLIDRNLFKSIGWKQHIKELFSDINFNLPVKKFEINNIKIKN